MTFMRSLLTLAALRVPMRRPYCVIPLTDLIYNALLAIADEVIEKV